MADNYDFILDYIDSTVRAFKNEVPNIANDIAVRAKNDDYYFKDLSDKLETYGSVIAYLEIVRNAFLNDRKRTVAQISLRLMIDDAPYSIGRKMYAETLMNMLVSAEMDD